VTSPIEIVNTAMPQTIDGEKLDHNCLHCVLALPVQHFIDRHPDRTREQLITEVCEVVAELIGSSTPHWGEARSLRQFAVEQINKQVYRKFEAFERLRQSN
jgi:hypothetical protein